MPKNTATVGAGQVGNPGEEELFLPHFHDLP
jgi:hypothetical protein